MIPGREIHIRSVGEGFDVLVCPAPPWPGVERHGLPNIRAAKRAADALATVHRWPIVDETVGAK